MIMVYTQNFIVSGRIPADGAPAALAIKHLFIYIKRNVVKVLQTPFPHVLALAVLTLTLPVVMPRLDVRPMKLGLRFDLTTLAASLSAVGVLAG